MKLHKTNIPGYYYHKNKNSISYYYSYKDKESKNSKRKKIFTCEEHTNKNLTHAINLTDDILKADLIKTVLKEENENLDETINLEHLTLNELVDLHHEKYYNQKVRELKELFAGTTDEVFNKNAVVKKKLYGIKRRILQYNKNIRNSSIGKMRFKDITRRHINNFLETELNTDLALKTKYNIIVYIRAAINSMKRNDYIKIDNVFDKLNIKNDKRQRTRVLNSEEIDLLLLECKKWNKPVEVEILSKKGKPYKRIRKPNYNIYTAVYIGLITASRSSTILTIKKKDINLKEETITLINHKANNKKYKIPLNKTSVEWFKKKLKFYKDNDYLLQPNTPKGRKLVGEDNPLTFIPREVFNIMNRLFNENIDRKVNLERDEMVNFHTLRRSIATLLAKSGVSIYKIKKLLDHKTVDITEHYLNLNHLDYKENLELFHNKLFKNFDNLLGKDKPEPEPNSKSLTIDNVKEQLIKTILVLSKNENNEIIKLALESLTEEELKQKLTTYI